MLNRDGTFVQTVAVNREKPVAARGSWEFDQYESRLTLHGAMVVDEDSAISEMTGNGPSPIVAPSVEMDRFRVVIASGHDINIKSNREAA